MTSHRIGRGRDGNRISLNNMIFLSLLLHALVLSAILFSPTMPSPRWTFGPVYSVELVSLSEGLEKPTLATSKELMETGLGERPIILKKRIDTTTTGPIRSVEIQKKQTGVEKTMENIRQRVLSLSKTQDRVTPPVATEGTWASSSTQHGDAEVDVKMKAYYAIIWEGIKGQWVLPPDILSGKGVEAIIHLRILRNGMVTDVNFEKRSGNRYFDESTMKAIEKAVPFPPLPERIREASIEVGIRFHSSQMR